MKKVIIVGGGKSVREGIELGLWEKIKDEETWALNESYKFMRYPPSRILWVDDKDQGFFGQEAGGVLMMNGIHGCKLTAKDNYDKYKDFPQIETYPTTRERWDTDRNKLFVGQYSLTGLFALSLACRMFDIIYLLGYDWGTPNFRDTDTHFYKKDKCISSKGIGKIGIYLNNQSHPTPNVHDFQVYLREGKVIKNVSPKSNIEYFEKINYEQFFDEIKEVSEE